MVVEPTAEQVAHHLEAYVLWLFGLVMFTMSLTNAAGIRNVWYGTRGTLDCEKWMIAAQ